MMSKDKTRPGEKKNSIVLPDSLQSPDDYGKFLRETQFNTSKSNHDVPTSTHVHDTKHRRQKCGKFSRVCLYMKVSYYEIFKYL